MHSALRGSAALTSQCKDGSVCSWWCFFQPANKKPNAKAALTGDISLRLIQCATAV